MNRAFAKTSNVTRFSDAMNRLHHRPDHLPGMALIYGDPGLGKTKTALWWVAQHEAIYVRVKRLMTGRWLLEELIGELGESPASRTSDLFRQCLDQLATRPRTIFIDEIDFFAAEPRVLETTRDLHDSTGTPIVFIGMTTADKRLKRYTHLWDRFIEVVCFQPLTRDDIISASAQLCEVALTDDAIDLIHSKTDRFRQVMAWLYRAEAVARANNLKEISASNLNGNTGRRNNA